MRRHVATASPTLRRERSPVCFRAPLILSVCRMETAAWHLFPHSLRWSPWNLQVPARISITKGAHPLSTGLVQLSSHCLMALYPDGYSLLSGLNCAIGRLESLSFTARRKRHSEAWLFTVRLTSHLGRFQRKDAGNSPFGPWWSGLKNAQSIRVYIQTIIRGCSSVTACLGDHLGRNQNCILESRGLICLE